MHSTLLKAVGFIVYPTLQVQFFTSILLLLESENIGQETQAELDVAEISPEYLPLSQDTQEYDPDVTLYFPGAQDAQKCEAKTVNPALQEQFSGCPLADGDIELFSQARQASGDTAWKLVENVPASQAIHKSLELAAIVVE